MEKLIKEVTEMIGSRLSRGSVNLIRMENFESPEIYMKVCSYFLSMSGLKLVGMIDSGKYREFQNAGRAEWAAAIDYLKSNGFVRENTPLTKLRNESAVMSDGTSLLLLMGAEAAVDKGSIKDFDSVSMADIVERIKKNYSGWFSEYLRSIDELSDANCAVINNIYKAVFQYNNVDAMKFSFFIDSLNERLPENMGELTEYIFSTLSEYWNMPSIHSFMPKTAQMKGKKSVKIITSSYEFINNRLNITSAKMKSLPERFRKFAEEMSIDEESPYMGFASYSEFENAAEEFLRSRSIDEYRAKFMNCDFGVINHILDLKMTGSDNDPPAKEKDTVVTLKGDPLEAYLQMILDSCLRFRNSFGGYMPIQLILEVTNVRISNCPGNDDSEKAKEDRAIEKFSGICCYMGGLVGFINAHGLSGRDITLKYIGNDPFDRNNTDELSGRIKPNDKWGDKSLIRFRMTACGESEDEVRSYEYKWYFSPYAGWKNAFSMLMDAVDKSGEKLSPLLLCCRDMQKLLVCEDEDEFYIDLESTEYSVLSRDLQGQIRKSFSGCAVLDKFNLVCRSFETWCGSLLSSGFFSCTDSMNGMIDDYRCLTEAAAEFYQQCSSVQEEKISLFLSCFSVISNERYIEDGHISEAMIPAYNPAMLEKINARNTYLIFGFSELFDNIDALTENNYQQKLSDISSLAEITQAVDLIPDGRGGSILCQNVWGYYALYYNISDRTAFSAGSIELMREITDDDSTGGASQASVIEHNISDYIRTFPARADGLNICFIDPKEIRYAADGIRKAADRLSKLDAEAVINVKIICSGGTKNVGGYLRYWLDSYMSKERSVKINAFLRYINDNSISDELRKLLEDQDICFIYDILRDDAVQFDRYTADPEDVQEQMVSCQFPMTFVPDTITASHAKYRKINISQMQFLVSRAYTQLAHKVIEPNAADGEYKVMQKMSLDSRRQEILNIAHEQCRWVVCEDRAIDRELIQSSQSRRVIGFTTGEGCFGEYNVTVSAKNAILQDICRRLKVRLIETFSAWNNEMAEKTAESCLELTGSFDGSRILKALNPYDYEVHNFLAYALMVRELGIGEPIEGKYISRNLINLDSYQHWFRNSGNRPDFMLVEIPAEENVRDDSPIRIRIKIIECKMGYHIDTEKAMLQVRSGTDALSSCWSPDNTSISRRYWFTQLYRAIAFSKLGINSNDDGFERADAKIFSILYGKFSIEWSGEIYAYDLTDKSDVSDTDEVEGNDVVPYITIHHSGQLYVQKKLLPDEFGGEMLEYSEPPEENESHDDITVSDHSDDYFENYDNESAEEITAEVNKTETFEIKEDIHENISDDKTERNCAVEIADENAERSVSDVRILLGSDLRTGEKYYWEFGNRELNNRHLLINGNSGFGKTYCIQGLLMESAMQGISSVVFDYTSGFTNTKLDPVFKNALGDRIKQRFIRVDKIPVNPFIKQEISIDDEMFVPENNVDVASKISEIFSTVYSLGDQQKSAVYSAVLNGLGKYGDRMNFRIMADELEEIGTSYAKTVLSKIQAFTDIDPFAFDEKFSWGDIRDSEGMVYIIQLAGYERDVQTLMTELLLWDIWSYSVKNGDESKPLILVLDEAQNLSHGDKSPSAKILTEGRKFGISGWYATQFMKPQLSDDEIQRLQQAGQKLYFCPPDDGVMTVAKNIDINPQGAKEWSERLKKLKKGECVTCGSMMRNGRWIKYDPKAIRITSLRERLGDE